MWKKIEPFMKILFQILINIRNINPNTMEKAIGHHGKNVYYVSDISFWVLFWNMIQDNVDSDLKWRHHGWSLIATHDR